MTDIALTWSNSEAAADMALALADLASDDGLQTAVIISLFTDARAGDDDRLPDGDAGLPDRRGWWGDGVGAAATAEDHIGSRLWLLSREKRLPHVLVRARGYADEALAWLIADGIASAVTVTAEWRGIDQLAMAIAIERPDGRPRHRFDFAWDATLSSVLSRSQANADA